MQAFSAPILQSDFGTHPISMRISFLIIVGISGEGIFFG